mmetsp:Transcript_29667/g.49629  ORF Transcript_29667/g.49629 Transcript_29667/m.49629 type:complete len:235 (+) Transcript_29667:48-752(+)
MEFVASSSATSNLRQKLEMLTAQREAIEAEADALHSELTSPGLNGEPPAGVNDPLVDAEGFPRADINIYNVKDKRRRLAELNTDYRKIMKELEETTHLLYQQSISDDTVSTSVTPATTASNLPQSDLSLSPIAKLDEVLPNSPAETAGIQEGDILIKFGTIVTSTESCLPAIARLVGQSVNSPILIVIQRRVVNSGEASSIVPTTAMETVELTLTPKAWGGRGLLGCHLSPIQQ